MDIEDQIKLEGGMVARGIAKAKNSDRSAIEGGRAADTSYGKALTRQFLPTLVEDLELYCTPKGATRFAKYRKLLRMIDADKACLLALRAVFQDPFSERTLVSLGKLIGGMIEDEIKFTLFQDDHKEYYNEVIKDFKRKNTVNYRHRKRVLTFKMNERDVAWEPWPQDTKLQIGMIMIDRILANTDLIETAKKRVGIKTHQIVCLTQEANTWIEKHKDHMALLSPEFMPTIVQPDDWIAMDIGGYYTPAMRRRAPLIKTRANEHKDILRSSDLSSVYEGANLLQKTSWRVNRKVHDVILDVWNKGLRIGMGSPDPIDIPASPMVGKDKEQFTEVEQNKFDEWRREAARLHSLEKDRVKKNFQAIRMMRSAAEYRDYDKFWYVWQCDFRGRFYAATAAFSPQGPDMGKALIEFSEPKMMGERGFYWMKVHFANLRGHDKVTFDDRSIYTDSYRDEILDCANDPLGRSRHLWVDADKQYCALACIFELAVAYEEGPDNAPNRIAPAQDGSCNGLQHYAAILRDPVGAVAVNVSPSAGVADVYSAVGEVCGDKLRSIQLDADDENATVLEAWKVHVGSAGLPRKLAKKPVMTLPYGSTQRSCTDSVLDYLADIDDPLFPTGTRMRAATFLTKYLWASIGEVVTSAREAMAWIQDVARIMARANEPLLWVTPTGFPVFQKSNKIKTRRVHTQLGGDISMSIGEFTDELDPRKQGNGAAPNYVHSMDASHLLFTILRAKDTGITSFAVIHDSFGTYACDTEALRGTIQQAFVDLYADWEPLRSFLEQQSERTGVHLPEPPVIGDFDIRGVLSSPYFFG